MDEFKQKFPDAAPERRLRSRSRSNYASRRSTQRYLTKFPATIFVGQGKDAKTYEATVRDISSGGIMIEAPGVPPEEQRVRVKFRTPEGVMPEEFIQGVVATNAEVRNRDDEDPSILSLEFEEDLSDRYQRTSWAYLRWLAVLVLLAASALIVLTKYENFYYFWFDVPVFLYSLLVGGYLLTRFLFAAFYNDSKPLAELPPVSVVIPVRNEEEYITRTLTQLMECDYPRDRLQVIAVDDGSSDSTLEVMKASQKIYPELVILGMAKNVGILLLAHQITNP